MHHSARAVESPKYYLIADPRLQAQTSGTTLTLHQFERYQSDPVLVAEYGWEGKTTSMPGAVEMGGTVLYDKSAGLFKMWYDAWTTGFTQSYVCYAVSLDGVNWTKPNLGIHEYNGSKVNNIMTIGNATGVNAVWYDPLAAVESKRWVMWGKQGRPGEDGFPADYAVYRFYSPDGTHWTRESSEPNLPYHYPDVVLGGVMGDAGSTFWLPNLGKHVGIHQTVHRPNPRTPPSYPNEPLRIFVRFDSEDGLTWSEPTVAFDSEPEDLAIDPYHQFYKSTITTVGGSFLGLLSEYHPEQGTIDQGFAISTDTLTWVRPFHGNPVLPLGAEGAFDSKMIESTGQILEKDDKWWLYYDGAPWRHNEPVSGQYYKAIGLAQMPAGRIVSVDAGGEGGTLTTAPISFDGTRLEINAATEPGGAILVEVLDAEGVPIDGFSMSDPFSGDELHYEVTFNGWANLAALLDQTISLRFQIESGQLYAFEIFDQPGDLDRDGIVGGADLDIVRRFWGQAVTPGDKLHGDPSGDGFVDMDDLDFLRLHWGEGTQPIVSDAPEPAAIGLLISGIVAVLLVRQRESL